MAPNRIGANPEDERAHFVLSAGLAGVFICIYLAVAVQQVNH